MRLASEGQQDQRYSVEMSRESTPSDASLPNQIKCGDEKCENQRINLHRLSRTLRKCFQKRALIKFDVREGGGILVILHVFTKHI